MHYLSKLFAYSILTVSLFLAVLSPAYLQLVGGYSIPTATCAHVLTSASNAPIFDWTDYWSYALRAEVDYPIPSIFLAMYGEILGLSPELKIFQPAAGLLSLVYFVFALKVLTLGKIKRDHALLLSAIYYFFVVTGNLYAQYIGRATLGAVLMIYFFLMLLVHLSHYRKEGLIALLLLTTSIGLTYYTSSLAIFLIGTFLYPLVKLISMSDYRRFKPYKELFIPACLVIVITIMRPVFVLGTLADISLAKFYDNLWEYIKAQLKIEKVSEAYFLNVGLSGEICPVIRVTQIWLRSLTNLIAAITLFIFFFKTIVKTTLITKRKKKEVNSSYLNVYTIMAFICSCAELAYTFVAPTFSLRFFSIFGLPILLYVTYSSAKLETASRGSTSSKLCKAILTVFLGVLLIISSTSIIMFQQHEVGSAKMYGYEKVKGLIAYFMVGEPMTKITIMTDSYYSAILYYVLRIANSKIIVEPLGPVSITLYFACNNISLYGDLAHQLRSRGIILVLNETIYGDPWGYAVRICDCKIASLFNLVYSDSRFIFLV